MPPDSVATSAVEASSITRQRSRAAFEGRSPVSCACAMALCAMLYGVKHPGPRETAAYTIPHNVSIVIDSIRMQAGDDADCSIQTIHWTPSLLLQLEATAERRECPAPSTCPSPACRKSVP